MGQRPKFTFFKYGLIPYQIKGNHAYSIMEANILPADSPPPTLGVAMGSKGRNSNFSEHGQIAYRIKWNRGSSNMQEHILSLHTHLRPLGEIKGQNIFLKVVMLHIKREWSIEHHASTYTFSHPRPMGWGQRSNIFF